jgi:serine/threonine protein kinase/formylglycine-generating enzyme required for sulfatase activity
MSDDDSVTGLVKLVGSELGAYRIEKLLGAGGMGAVFVGRHVKTGWERAIKVIRPEMAALDEFRRRFLDEAKILDGLNHPNILRVYELAEAGPHLYLVTELLVGTTVGAKAREGRPPIPDVCAWFEQALAGVAEAHRRGVLHRDLKPENLFLTDKGAVKVLDFGIAKAVDETARHTTTSTRTPGSPPYMAPELVEGKSRPSAKSDVYAMGISLYETLVGHTPFGGEIGEDGSTTGSALSIMYAHVHTPLPDPRAARSDISDGLAAVLRTATAKKPEERYQDAEHMRLSLAAAASGALDGPGKGLTKLALPSFSPSPTPTSSPSPSDGGPPRKKKMWPWLAVAGVVVAGGGTVLALQLTQKKPEPPPVVAATGTEPRPAPPDAGPKKVEPPPDPRLTLNRWIKIPKPSTKVELGLADKDHDHESGLGKGLDTFAGPEFEIQAHEVTWAEYLASKGQLLDGATPPPEADRAKLPVIGVPYAGAAAYCEALSGDLPTEAQWEFAARGVELRPHPWGSDPVDLDRLHAYVGAAGGPQAVETSRQDVTPEGVHDLAGNAAEWTRTKYRMEKGQTPPWTERFRAVRGLPLRDDRPTSLPRFSSTYRWKGCAAADCAADELAALGEVGFRCVRQPAPKEDKR